MRAGEGTMATAVRSGGQDSHGRKLPIHAEQPRPSPGGRELRGGLASASGAQRGAGTASPSAFRYLLCATRRRKAPGLAEGGSSAWTAFSNRVTLHSSTWRFHCALQVTVMTEKGREGHRTSRDDFGQNEKMGIKSV